MTLAPDLPGLRFLEPLGSGGFSEVLLYERDQPRIKVAVKLMRADVLDDVQRRQFVAEADVMAELAEHPYIVPVLGAGTAPDGRPYLVMRYYPPPDLGQRVAKDPLSVPDALRTGIQLASAIETAHRSGIVHRDIKPANVLVSSYGVPGLSDFGIAGRAGDSREEDENVGVSMPWSPPEVLTGTSNGTVVSDVYSLGATIWNLLVGRSPFTVRGGDNGDRALFTRIVHSKPPVTGRADVPGSLDRLLQQTMSKKPEHRPQTAMELARHLQRVEQELRLARTDIVVLDSAPTDSAPTLEVHSFAPPRAQTPDGEPGRAQPAPPPSPPDAPPESPPARPTQLRPPTRVSPAPVAVAASPATPAPAARLDPPPSQPQDAATILRPSVVNTPESPAPREPGPATAQQSGARRSKALAIGMAALLLVGVIAGGSLLTRGGEPSAESPLPDGPQITDPADLTGGDSLLVAPEVQGSRSGNTAVFTWPDTQDGVEYGYRLDRDQRYRPVRGTRVELPLEDGGEVCVQVVALRGSEAAESNTTCVSAA